MAFVENLAEGMAGAVEGTVAEKSSTVVDQIKLSPQIQAALLALCKDPATPKPYLRRIVVDRNNVLAKLAEVWPNKPDEHIQALWQQINEVVQEHPVGEDANGKMMLQLSLAPARLEPSLEDLRNDKVSIATVDCTTGLVHRCVIPEDEKKPELCHLAIEAGLMLLCEPFKPSPQVKETPAAMARSGVDKFESGAVMGGDRAHTSQAAALHANADARHVPTPVGKQRQKVKNTAKTLIAAGTAAETIKLLRNGQAKPAQGLSTLRKKIRRDLRGKDKKRVMVEGEDDDNTLDQEALSLAMREMQLQSEALAAAQQALAHVQHLEAEYYATPVEERTPAQYEALTAAYENARVQLAIEEHHAGLARSAMAQAQKTGGAKQSPNAALGLARHQQIALQGGQASLPEQLLETAPVMDGGEKNFAAPKAMKKEAAAPARDQTHTPQATAPLLVETPQ